MRQFGLVGYPLAHSFSPAYFKEKFLREGITGCNYELFPLSSIELIHALILDNPLIEGLNVTIPFKKEIVSYLSYADDAVNATGACNCIKIINGQLYGYNTDVTGFEQSLLPLLNHNHLNALVLGSGGSSSSVQFVLKKLGINYKIISRQKKQQDNILTYHEISSEVMKQHQLIINTTPVGMYPDIDDCPDIPYQYLTDVHVLFDLIYNPTETLFLKKGSAKGAIIKTGFEMLVIQAEESWKIWQNPV